MAVYDALADEYQGGMARITALHADDMADALELREGDCVLDAASGTGAIATAIAERVGANGRVVAVDLAGRMLAHARARLESTSAALRFVRCDAERLPLRDARFDGVACGFGIQHMSDPDAALGAMRAALRPGGRCAVSAWAPIGRDIKTPAQEAFLAVTASASRPPARESWSSPGYLARRMVASGFVDVQERASRGCLLVADLDEWWHAIVSGRLGDALRTVGPETAARIRADAHCRAESFAERTADGWVFPSGALIAVGVKP